MTAPAQASPDPLACSCAGIASEVADSEPAPRGGARSRVAARGAGRLAG